MQVVFDEMYAKIDLGEHVLSETGTSGSEKKATSSSTGAKNGQSGNHGESISANTSKNRNQEESKGAEYGEMGFKFETLNFPTS